MKKALLILLFIGFAAVSQAALVDDFESYATGNISAGREGVTNDGRNVLTDHNRLEISAGVLRNDP